MGELGSGVWDGLLRKFSRFVPLNADDRLAVQRWTSTSRWVDRARDLPLDRSGQTCTLLVSGVAARHKMAVDGKLQILAFYFPGDLLDLNRFFDRDDGHELVAISRLQLASVAIADLRRTAAERPNIARAITTDLLVEAAIGREWLLSIGHRSASARVAHLLCECAVRLSATGYGGTRSFDFPFTQSDMAHALGLTSVHVNRTLRSLKEEGLIEYGTGHVLIHDQTRLSRRGDFDPRYLRELAGVD